MSLGSALSGILFFGYGKLTIQLVFHLSMPS